MNIKIHVVYVQPRLRKVLVPSVVCVKIIKVYRYPLTLRILVDLNRIYTIVMVLYNPIPVDSFFYKNTEEKDFPNGDKHGMSGLFGNKVLHDGNTLFS